MIQSGKVDVTRQECCMCGDPGLFDELYRCRVCLFRSQHRYCSNQYPMAGSEYNVCNWCLVTPKEDSSNSTKKAAQNNSSDSISSHYKMAQSNQDDGHSKRSRSISWKPGSDLRSGVGSGGNGRVKKADNSPGVLPTTTPRKRIMTRGVLEEKLQRMKSEEMASRSVVIPRQVFRNKVRRYKLLNEVSC